LLTNKTHQSAVLTGSRAWRRGNDRQSCKRV